VYSESHDFDNAIQTYRELVLEYKGSPRLQESYFRLAYNLQMSEDYPQALSYYDLLEPEGDINGLYYASLKNKVLIYFAKDDNEKAAEVYDMIIRDFPGNDLGIDGYLWLVKRYIESGRYEDALRILKETEGRSGSETKLRETAYFKAEAYRETGDLQMAIENYDVVLSAGHEPDAYSGATRIGKGLCLVRLGEYDRGKEEFDTAIVENPDDNTIAMRAKYETAGIELLKGEPEQAYKLYMMVAILYDNSHFCPSALLKAAGIFEELGKPKEAKKAYQEILDRYGETEFAAEAKSRLKDIRWKLND